MTMLYAGITLVVLAGAAQAKQEREAGKSNAAIAENNARMAEQEGRDEAVQLARESQQAAWRTRAIMGSQRAAIAANGIDSETGNSFDLLGETALFGGAEQSAISQDAARRAWASQGETLNYRNQGAQAKWMGKNSSNITILKTIGSAGSMWASGMGAAKGATGGTSTKTAMSGASKVSDQFMNYRGLGGLGY